MKKISCTFFILTILFIGLIFIGCASKPLEQQYPERWEKTYVGMSLDEFKIIWPGAKYGGYGDFENTTEVWTFAKQQSFVGVQIIYFTFQEDKLLRFIER